MQVGQTQTGGVIQTVKRLIIFKHIRGPHKYIL